MRTRSGTDTLIVERGMDPKSMVRITMSAEAEYSAEESYLLKSMGELLTIKLIETLREEMSGVYGTSAYGGMSRGTYDSYYFGIGFPCGRAT